MSIELSRFGFVPPHAYDVMTKVYYGAMTIGNSKLVTYAYPAGSSELAELAGKSNLEVVNNDNSEFVIAAINAGLDRVYSCNYECALAVVTHFEGG